MAEQPYEGEKDYRGYPAKTDEEVFKYAKEAIARDEQLLAHCNGDAASEQFLDSTKKRCRKAIIPIKISCGR